MNFAIRDDDLNFFFSPEKIEENYNKIWNICPISMSVVPFIKGNWKDAVERAEKRGPGKRTLTEMAELKKDNIIHPIGDNLELVEYVKRKISEHKIYLTSHGIHHRNEDEIIPQFDNNFGSGAEFYTDRDLTSALEKSISYLENLFGQKITVFCPSQNLYSEKGLKAIINNNLKFCGSIPSLKHLPYFIRILGYRNYVTLFFYRLFHKNKPYPYSLHFNKLHIIAYHNLRPSTDIESVKKMIDFYNSCDGSFVLATHSYAFDYKMNNSKMTMRDALVDIVNYAQKVKNINFTTINNVFK